MLASVPLRKSLFRVLQLWFLLHGTANSLVWGYWAAGGVSWGDLIGKIRASSGEYLQGPVSAAAFDRSVLGGSKSCQLLTVETPPGKAISEGQ